MGWVAGMPCLAWRFGCGVVTKSRQASARLDVSLREIVAFEQQRRAVSLRAGVGEAVAKIELRGVPALAVSLETFDREAPDAFIDWRL